MAATPKPPKRKSTQYKPLTAMQEAYCQSYIKNPENQSKAAIDAGFSPNTAAVKASVMMRDERIQKRIAELMEERNKRMRVSADYVLMRLVEIDQMDVLDILNDDGSLKQIREWPKIWRTTLSGFDLSSTIMNMNEDSIETILKKIKNSIIHFGTNSCGGSHRSIVDGDIGCRKYECRIYYTADLLLIYIVFWICR